MTDFSASYNRLSWNDSNGDEAWTAAPLKSSKARLKDTALLVLAVSTSVLLILILKQSTSLQTSQKSYGAVLQEPSYIFHSDSFLVAAGNGSESWTRYSWWSKYSSANPEDGPAVDHAWDSIVPAHGIVAVDHRWAAEKQLPPSMSLPSDAKKGVYIIDAYHQIHCLVQRCFRHRTLYPMLTESRPSSARHSTKQSTAKL